MPLTSLGDSIGNLYPVRIPTLLEQANVREALELFYYGNNVSGPTLTLGQEAELPSDSLAGRLHALYTSKLDKNNGSVTGTFTVDNGSSPTLTLKGTTYKFLLTGTPATSDKTITFQNATGTVALTSETQLASLININGSTTTHTITLGYGTIASGQTRTINIGTASHASANTNITIGPTTGTTRTVTLNGAVSMPGTLSVTGALTSPTLTVGASGPTIKSGSAAPSAGDGNGSLYLRTAGTYETSLYVRAAGAWYPFRSAKWFTGTTTPSNGIGEVPGDLYFNRATGDVWLAS